MNILRIDSSPRLAASDSRKLTDKMVARLQREYPAAAVIVRDLAKHIIFPNEAYTWGTVYNAQSPTADQQAASQFSNELAAELLAADLIVLGMPIYNWTIPSTFKAYIDQISRPGVTFAYVDGKAIGKLKATDIYILFTTGGTEIGSYKDFATPYTTFLWKTLGVTNVHWIEANGMLYQAEASLAKADAAIASVALPTGS